MLIPVQVLRSCNVAIFCARIVTYTIVPSVHSLYRDGSGVRDCHFGNPLIERSRVPPDAVHFILSMTVPLPFLITIYALSNTTSSHVSFSVETDTEVPAVVRVPRSWKT